MPIGSRSVMYEIINQLVDLKPKSVLDLGIGFGILGPCIRQWVDKGVKPYRTKLTGIEIHDGYKNPSWDLYDRIFHGEASACVNAFLLNKLSFDVIVVSDVIEHFEKQEGQNLITKLAWLLNPGGIILVGTPAITVSQGAVNGNEYERHWSSWSVEDFNMRPGLEGNGITEMEVIKDGTPDNINHRMILVKYKKHEHEDSTVSPSLSPPTLRWGGNDDT